MNDDQIRSELERRATSTSSRPDWAKRVLLPAVWREVDARPQRVMTSNWSPRLSVVAVVVALLIMVIAVPRLALQPPSSSASPSATESPTDVDILSTAKFNADWAAGRLNGQTVLVQGGISFLPIYGPARPPCLPPDGLCLLGGLDGTGTAVYSRYTPTTDAPGSGLWAASDGGRDYHFPTPPIEGVLVLRVLGEAEVEFVGLVHETATGNALTVADASALDPTTLGPDAAVLVRGYLVDTSRPGRIVDIDCTINPYPVISGLPNRYCTNTDFLSSLSPNTDFGPNPDRLRVQVGAADRFASNFQGREALYAISPRLYGGCDNGSPPPCWLWDVVARVGDPTAIASPAPAPSPSPPIPTATPLPTPMGTAFECPPTWGDSGMHATIVDHIGLVLGCTQPDRPMFDWSQGDGLRMGNPGNDLNSLQIEWDGDPCMADREYTLLATGDGYVLEGRATYGGTSCILPRVIHVIRLSLTEPVDASMVAFAWNSAPPPTPSPSPIAPGTHTLACGSDSDGSAIEFVDHSGLVTACMTRQPADSLDIPADAPPRVTNFADQQHVVVTWPIGSACSMGPADLEFWGPVTHSEPYLDQIEPNYVMRITRLDITSCSGVARMQSVEFVLHAPVFADDIEAFVSEISKIGGGNFTTLKTATSVGSFELDFGGGNVDWVAGEPIDISALLTYEGPDDKVALAGAVTPDFGFEQLDGTLEVMPGGTINPCPQTLPFLKRNVGERSDFRVSEGIGSEQYMQYFDDYGYDDQFRLPPGTYRLYAFVNANAQGCGGEPVKLLASVVIQVR